MTIAGAIRLQAFQASATAGASRRRSQVTARRGIVAVADVCRGLFGGLSTRQCRTSDRLSDETLEIVITRATGKPLAPAA